MIEMQWAPNIIENDETLTLRRFNANLEDPLGIQIVGGKRVLGEFTEYQIQCNVQPVTGDDVVQEPAGDRYDDQYYLWVWDTSEQPLPNDLVYRDGWYKVLAATGWGSFTQARMQMIDVGEFRSLGF
jgi:hypothetical protein